MQVLRSFRVHIHKHTHTHTHTHIHTHTHTHTHIHTHTHTHTQEIANLWRLCVLGTSVKGTPICLYDWRKNSESLETVKCLFLFVTTCVCATARWPSGSEILTFALVFVCNVLTRWKLIIRLNTWHKRNFGLSQRCCWSFETFRLWRSVFGI
jgi:hypothetical protein